MNTETLSITESQHGDTVRPVGHRPYRQQQCREADGAAEGAHCIRRATVLIDLAAVKYLTSAAFRVLLVANGSLKEKNGQLALCGVTGHVRELFEMGGLLQSFTIFPSREEAFSKLT